MHNRASGRTRSATFKFGQKTRNGVIEKRRCSKIVAGRRTKASKGISDSLLRNTIGADRTK